MSSFRCSSCIHHGFRQHSIQEAGASGGDRAEAWKRGVNFSLYFEWFRGQSVLIILYKETRLLPYNAANDLDPSTRIKLSSD
jgi:hypothetical protein